MIVHREKISTILLKTRVSRGYSQTYLARKLGITQKAYSNIESGHCKLDLIRFLKIAHYTETHPIQLIEKIISGNPSWGTNDAKEKALNQDIEKLIAEIKFLKSENQFLKNTINKLLDKKAEEVELVLV